MKINLIIDGNYILNKNVFTLHKVNTLYGDLWNAMINNVNKFKDFGEFEKIFVVCDSSKKKSWRKEILPEYKSHRTKDDTIDWKFVYDLYDEFKNYAENEMSCKVVEAPHIEGDDWIGVITRKSNAKGTGVMLVTSDKDMQQLLQYNLDPLWMNIQVTDEFDNEKMYLPEGYQLVLDRLIVDAEEKESDIFDLTTISTWSETIKYLIGRYKNSSVNPVEVLFRKILEGDSSDNIKSLYETTQNLKTGGTRNIGIGAATGEKIWKLYSEAYPEYCAAKYFREDDFIDRFIPLLENVKNINISDNERKDIIAKWKRNVRLIELNHRHMPEQLLPYISSALKEVI